MSQPIDQFQQAYQSILNQIGNPYQWGRSMAAGGYVGGPATPALPPMPKDFHGFDLAVGEVYGYRTWNLDPLGRLRAVGQPRAKPWRPGVNTASCTKYPDGGNTRKVMTWVDDTIVSVKPVTGKVPVGQRQQELKGEAPVYVVDQFTGERMHIGTTTDYSWLDTAGIRQTKTVRYDVTHHDGSIQRVEKVPPQHEVVKTDEHLAPVEACGCGFYAYTAVEHDEYSYVTHGIHGIIKGTGRALIGTKGFRCEKAEIVALLDPTHGGSRTSRWRVDAKRKLQRVYPEIPLIESRAKLMEFAPIDKHPPDPSSDEFWDLP